MTKGVEYSILVAGGNPYGSVSGEEYRGNNR